MITTTSEDLLIILTTKSHLPLGKCYLKWNIDYIFCKNVDALAFRAVVEDYGLPYIFDHYLIIAYFNYIKG